MQSLRAIRDIDQDGVTEDTFHDVRLIQVLYGFVISDFDADISVHTKCFIINVLI